MATVTITRAGDAADLVVPPVPTRTLKLTSTKKKSVTLPIAPLPTSHGGFAPSTQSTDRVGRAPLLDVVAPSLGTWSGSITVAYADWATSIDALLQRLEQIAAAGDPVSMAYARPERGLWLITDMSYEVVQRSPDGAAPSRANVSLSMTRTSTTPQLVGPARKSPAASSKSPAPSASSSGGKHTVAAGESLASISIAEYGTNLLWRSIADANGLRDPRRLSPGMVLRIPAQ